MENQTRLCNCFSIFAGTIILGVVAFLMLPLLLQQLDKFANRLPNWIDSESIQLQTFKIWINNQKLPFDKGELTTQLKNVLITKMQVLPTYAIALLLKAFDRILELLVVLVLTFYLLTHGHDFWTGIWQRFPDIWADRWRSSFKQSF